jgi:predicted O-methyltransferase YrrM
MNEKFLEGCIHIPGQMWIAERKFLYDLVKRYRPEIAIEVGTWKGGGSTYFIASALSENKKGKLFTVESCEEFYKEAVQAYKTYLPELCLYVNFLFGESCNIYPTILKGLSQIDLAFFDGGDDPSKAVKEFEIFDSYFHKGSIIVMHDWNNEKMSLMKPFLIKRFIQWEKIGELSFPQSQVGIVAFIHI